MANEEHLSLLGQGVDVWNQWRLKTPSQPDLKNADLRNIDLRSAYLTHADLSNADLSCADLSNADLTSATLNHANLSRANLSYATLSHSNLSRATLSHAKLDYANLAGVDLNTADLSSASFGTANLGYSNFSYANLSGADLGNADLSHADLNAANLNAVNLSFAALTYANLNYANLSHADLSHADLKATSLRYTDFTDARIGWTVFSNVVLSEVKGLETIRHAGPSTLGLDTVHRSKGNIPNEFLLEAGVSKEFIEHLQSFFTDQLTQSDSCLIIYSSQDEKFARRLRLDLQDKGVHCWLTLENSSPQELGLFDKILLILSDSSMNSWWVKTTIYTVLQQQVAEQRRKLFPLGLVSQEQLNKWQVIFPNSGKDISNEVRAYFVPDFTEGKTPDTYKIAFSQLLRELESE